MITSRRLRLSAQPALTVDKVVPDELGCAKAWLYIRKAGRSKRIVAPDPGNALLPNHQKKVEVRFAFGYRRDGTEMERPR